MEAMIIRVESGEVANMGTTLRSQENMPLC